MSTISKAFLTSRSQTWATPWTVIRALGSEGFKFTLDVSASPETAKAAKFYTEEKNNAWSSDWVEDSIGGDIWCNPPYGDPRYPVKHWVLAAWSIRNLVRTVLLLPANKTDQDWFHDLVIPHGQYRPVRGRIGFLDGQGKPVSGNSQGSMLIIFGPGIKPCPPVTFDYRTIRKMEKVKSC
jgi:phage N-6-adenine-methyltransferase